MVILGLTKTNIFNATTKEGLSIFVPLLVAVVQHKY